MDSHVRNVFIGEVERQAKFGLMAVADLNAALASHDTDRVWHSIQSLLIAAGNVSKLLWPAQAYAQARKAWGQVLQSCIHAQPCAPGDRPHEAASVA